MRKVGVFVSFVAVAALTLSLPRLSHAASFPSRRVPLRPASPAELDVKRPDSRLLLFHGVAYDPLVEIPDFAAKELPEGSDEDYGLVQLTQDLPGTREALEREGVAFLGYIPNNAFPIRLTPATRAVLKAHPGVRWFGNYPQGLKVHARLWKGSGDVTPEITVALFPGAQSESIAEALTRELPEVVPTFALRDGWAPRLRFSVPLSARPDFVRRAASLSGVSWMEPYDPPQLHNNDSLGPVQSNATTVLSAGNCTSCSIFAKGITGTAQIVAVADSGNDSDMCFFRKSASILDVTDAENTLPPTLGTLSPSKKVIGYWVQPGATAYDNNQVCGTSSTSFHGTHTSGTAVGDNFATPSTPVFPGIDTGDGMAPNAQLLFQDVGHDTTGCLSGLSDLYAMFLQAANGGARLHSNSYGSNTGGAYTSDDQTADRFLFDHEEMAIFFSAGNSGSSAMTIGSPGNSKNVVTVGALGHGTSTTVAGFSSRGPTADGRLKPDIQAPGSSTVSAGGDTSHVSNNCGTSPKSGTSMSCPTVAGAAALLRQYFSDGFYPSGTANTADRVHPRAPVIKAVLLNGTRPLGSSPAFGHNDYGWGRIFLDNNLYFAGDNRELRVFDVPNTDGLTTGQSRSYTVTVGAGQEFRATLVWSDAEGTLGAAVSLVNDLDLTVSDGVNTYRGNMLNTSGVSVAGGSADNRNTVEQVRFTAPVAGTYTLTVLGTAIPGNGRAYTSRQGFALAVSYAQCATAVAAAPTGLLAVNNPTMGVDLAFAAAPASTSTQIYRAPGDCTAPLPTFQYIGSSAGGSFTDPRAQGNFPYAYRLRGADGCGEGPASVCVAITPSGRCDLVPVFSGLASAAQAGTQCLIRLAWNTATPACPTATGVKYNVYRSTTPNFVPGPASLLVSGLTARAFDDASVASGTTYFYAVRAEDNTVGGSGPLGGNEEPNNAQLFATALGAPGASGTFTDNGGDTAALLSNQPPWHITALQSQAGTRSYHGGVEGGSYLSNLCSSVTTPSLSLGVGSVLSYYVRYNVEYQWDGAVVEISTDGGLNWANLPPNGGYGAGNTLAQTQGNGCGFSSSQAAFTGPSGNGGLTAWTLYQTNLSPTYDNKTVRVRWRFTSDSGAEFQGVFLDSISMTNVFVPGACTAPPANTPPSVTPAVIARQVGSPASISTLATLSDAETAAASLGVAVTGTSAGISVSGLSQVGGTVSAAVAAACNAAVGSNTITLQAMDASAATGTGAVTVNVSANSPPTLGMYPNPPALTLGAGTTVVPVGVPGDNGSVVSLTAAAPGFTGSFSGNPATGILTIANAGPAGSYPVTVTATDNCGTTMTAAFTLVVLAPAFYTLPPCRIVDTRNGPPGPYAQPALAASATRNFQLTGQCGVPATARAAVVNQTAVNATAAGYLVSYAAGQSLPGTVNVLFSAAQTRANNAIVAIGTNGEISVYCGMATGQTDFVLDVSGYFE